MKTKEEIEQEIRNLIPMSDSFDTAIQTDEACVAAGAHDALRWALGLAEMPISESLKHD